MHGCAGASFDSVLGDAAATHSFSQCYRATRRDGFGGSSRLRSSLFCAHRDETEVKPVIVGVTQRRQPRTSGRLLRPCSMEGSDIEATLSRRLHEAVRKGDAGGVAAALSSGIVLADDPNKDSGGCTAILEATRYGQAAVASVLLDFGCDACLGDNRGWTALHEVFKSPAVAKLLFENVPSAAWKSVADSVYGLTPLHACVKSAVSSSAAPTAGQLEVIREVASRCRADAVTLDGETCLHLAASGRYDRPEVVRVLLQAAPIRNVQNARGETALHLALINSHYKTAALLIDPPRSELDCLKLKTACQKAKLPRIPERGSASSEEQRQNCAHEAGRTDTVDSLAEDMQRSDVHDKDGSVKTTDKTESRIQNGDASHEANGSSVSSDAQEEAAQAVERTENKEVHSERAASGSTEVSGASNGTVDLSNSSDCSEAQTSSPPVQLRVSRATSVSGRPAPPIRDKHTQTTDLLDTSLCDRFGQTVLHYCTSRNAADLLEPLLRNYGVCDVQDLRGDTALHVAARRGHDKCVALLLDFGADASLRNDEGMTPLDLAIAAGFADATKILYENATEPLLRNADVLRRQDSVRRCTVIGKMFLEHSSQMAELEHSGPA